MSDNITLPGDKLSSIEEYEAGENTFDDGNMVRSTIVGTTQFDKKNRVVDVKNSKSTIMPQNGDIVIGTTAAVMGSMIAVTVEYVNGKKFSSNVECVCSTRNLRKRTVALMDDVVVLKVISHLNGTIHGTIAEPELGVLLTKCRKCGGNVLPVRDAVKCKDCSWIDDRQLSNNFGNIDFFKLREG